MSEPTNKRIVKLLTSLFILLNVLKDGTFASQQDFLEFREMILELGYDPNTLDDEDIIVVIKWLCAEFSKLEGDYNGKNIGTSFTTSK